MKKILRQFLILLFLVFIFYSQADATNFGVLLGLSTPNDQVNNVYNRSNFDTLGNLFREGTKLGYHVGLKLRVNMSDNLLFVGGIAYHKFPQSTIEVKDPTNNTEVITTITTSQNAVPITAGVNFFIIKKFIGLYAVGDLSYNYLFNTVDYDKAGLAVNMISMIEQFDKSDSRIGFGLGAGADLDVQIVTLNLEVKYNFINLIGAKDGEEAKAFVSVSLGAFF